MPDLGILTRHCYPNYGSFLQAYALSCALRDEGGQSRVIDYVPVDDSPRGLAASSLRESRMNDSLTGRTAFRTIQGPNLAHMARSFRKHQKRHLPLTPTIQTHSEVIDSSRSFDGVIAGSDQVWNTIHGSIDPTYFLADVSSRRYSYAASFGSTEVIAQNGSRIKSWLSDFEVVSVRELSAQVQLNELGIDSRVDVDPVLLHDRKYWSDFAGASTHAQRPYILVYQLHNTPEFDAKLSATLTRSRRKSVRRVTLDAKQLIRHRASDYMASPEKFVSLFQGASEVVTDSFHGTVFSLIFGKPVTVALPARNASRIEDLLRSLGLTNSDFGSVLHLDGSMVSEALHKKREASRQYIKRLTESPE